MSEVISVQVPLSLMREIEKCLEECGQDLECEIDARYPETQRLEYPSYQRKYENDILPARTSQKLVQAIRSQQWWSMT